MPFEKGKSGNPAGRPRQKPLIDWCKTWTRERAYKFLAPLAEDKHSKFQLEAIKTILAYGVGKPVEHQLIEDVTESSGATVEELGAEIARIIGKPEGAGPGLDKKGEVDGKQ